MATPAPSANPSVITVEKGDTLSEIARDYSSVTGGKTYQQLAAMNNISNPNLIYVGQEIKLTTGGSSGSSTSDQNKPTIKQFGLQSNVDAQNVLFATWTWSKDHTASYKAMWYYDTGDSVWFVGSDANITVDKDEPNASKQSTYTIPSNAKKVKFKVKPISEKYTKNKTETTYWTANWSDEKVHTIAGKPPATPSTPSIEIVKYTLTAEIDNFTVENGEEGIQFEVVKNDTTVVSTGKTKLVTSHAAYSCTVDAGAEYKVRCRAYKGESYGEWSAYSGNINSMPATPSGITTCKATSETSVYLEWEEAGAAKTYEIEYTTKKEYFDGSSETTTINNIEYPHYTITGLESGEEYFFRVRSVKDGDNKSGWTDIVSIIIGKEPAAPTTWSSSTTVEVGEELILYWVHNSEDGSSQTYAQLEITVGNNNPYTVAIENSTDEDEKDKTSSYKVDTTDYPVGTSLKWRVRTSGITNALGDWSVLRTIDIYAPSTLELSLTNSSGDSVNTISSFPFYISAVPGPKTQHPISYHLVVTANESYETVDNVGNEKIVGVGEEVYSKYFDTNYDLEVEFSAHNIDLETNISYTVVCTVAMNSGLTATASLEFTVSWTEVEYQPDAEIGIDEDTYSAYIKPFCRSYQLCYYKVTYNSSTRVYTLTNERITCGVFGTKLNGAKTSGGLQVFSGTTSEGDSVLYTTCYEEAGITTVWLSVYRREFDGTFTKLATGIDGSKNTTITDPHPALDFARYRIVATTKSTGAIGYYDPPGYPVGGNAAIIQWNEDWTTFDTDEADSLAQPPWTGSLLKLMYNIDVSDGNSPDVELIEYIGREHPVSYYGTHVGQKSTWNMEIPKSDKETLYGLRRLARWMGDVYVREPSGSGYWANVTVAFNQKHCAVTVPVTLDIVRVEGGV